MALTERDDPVLEAELGSPVAEGASGLRGEQALQGAFAGAEIAAEFT